MKAKTVKAMAKGRSIHLIDIDNLCREPNPTEAHVSQAKAAYFAKVQPGDQDLFYVIVSSRNNAATSVFCSETLSLSPTPLSHKAVFK